MSLRSMASRAMMTKALPSFFAYDLKRTGGSLAFRPFSSSVRMMNEPSSFSSASVSKASVTSSAEQQSDQQKEAARAELWNQMLNTIIVEPPEKPAPGVGGSEGAAGSHGRSGADAQGANRRDGSQGMLSMIEQLDMDFRERPTFGLSKPSTPITGRSVSMPNAYNNTSATLYRQISQILNRNNVRRELRLNDRYEKPNQKRRRKRSERHRRRFADMIRKKLQLVRMKSSPAGCLTCTDYDAQSTECMITVHAIQKDIHHA